jgi:hypothetical protein
MDAKTQQIIKDATDNVVRELMLAEDFRALNMVLMQTEATLGDIERKEFQNEEPDLDYIDALDSAWGVMCEAAQKKSLSLAEDDASLANELRRFALRCSFPARPPATRPPPPGAPQKSALVARRIDEIRLHSGYMERRKDKGLTGLIP